jgi:hypothetical protein
VPRKSADALAGEAWRRMNAPPPPPRPEPPAVLSGRAREYWINIVNAYPPDYFDAANRIMLECLCMHLVVVDVVWPELEKLDISKRGDLTRYRKLAVTLARQSSMCSMIMTKLRLLPTKYMAQKALEQPARGNGTVLPWERHR